MILLEHKDILLARDVGYTNIRGNRELDPVNTADKELYHSITREGILNPLIVVPFEGSYLLLDGEGRYQYSKSALSHEKYVAGDRNDEDEYVLPCIIRHVEILDGDHYNKLQWAYNVQTPLSLVQKIKFFTRLYLEGTTATIISQLYKVSLPNVSTYLGVGKSSLMPLVEDGSLKYTLALRVLQASKKSDELELYQEALKELGSGFTEIKFNEFMDKKEMSSGVDTLNTGGAGGGLSPLTTTPTYVNGGDTPFDPFAKDILGDPTDEFTPDLSEATELPAQLPVIPQVGNVVDLSESPKKIQTLNKIYELLEETNIDPMYIVFLRDIMDTVEGKNTDKKLIEIVKAKYEKS